MLHYQRVSNWNTNIPDEHSKSKITRKKVAERDWELANKRALAIFQTTKHAISLKFSGIISLSEELIEWSSRPNILGRWTNIQPDDFGFLGLVAIINCDYEPSQIGILFGW